MKTILIATRKSPLALWQAEWVKSKLEESGLKVELVPVETKGDTILNTTIHKIGSKGVFTEELEEMLMSGEADIAVHSAKDLASELPDGFSIISLGERESIQDVLVSHQEIDLSEELIIGTSSTRRTAQLKRNYPKTKAAPVRGNLQTRIDKMKGGEADALILAKAGVVRMGLEDLIKHEFSLEEFTPAAGQGSIAIEAFETIHPTIRKLIKAATNDSNAWTTIHAERAFLKKLGGGCSIPVFAHCTKEAESLKLSAGIFSLDGSEDVKVSSVGADPEELGDSAATQLLEEGGDKILQEIKDQLGYL